MYRMAICRELEFVCFAFFEKHSRGKRDSFLDFLVHGVCG